MKTAQNVNANPVLISYIPAGTIAVGEPIGWNSQLAAAAAVGIMGLAFESVTVADKVSTCMTYGTMKVLGGGAISVGERVKVAAGGKFVAIAGTDLADGKAVGTALTECTGDDAEFDIFIGKI